MTTHSHAEILAAVAAASGQQEAPQEAPDADSTPEATPDSSDAPKPTGDAASAKEEAKVEDGEAPKDEEAEGEKKAPSKAWAAIYRKERAIREREGSIKSREAQLQEQAAAIDKANKLIADFEADPYKFSEERGFDYDKWAQRRLAGGKPDPLDKVSAQDKKIAEMEARLAERDQAAVHQQMEARAAQWVAAVPAILEDPKYALVRDYPGGVDAVTTVAAMVMKDQGKWLTQREAADIIAAELESRRSILEQRGHIARPKATKAAPKSPHVKTGQHESVPDETNSQDEEILQTGTREQRIEVLAKRLRWT